MEKTEVRIHKNVHRPFLHYLECNYIPYFSFILLSKQGNMVKAEETKRALAQKVFFLVKHVKHVRPIPCQDNEYTFFQNSLLQHQFCQTMTTNSYLKSQNKRPSRVIMNKKSNLIYYLLYNSNN